MQRNEVIQINNNLLNAITPYGGIEFTRNKFMLGECFARVYVITKYPPMLKIGWASKLSNLPDVIYYQQFEPTDNGELLAQLAKSISNNNGLIMSTKDALERQRAERAVEDAEELMKKIDQMGEKIGYMTVAAMIISRDEIALEKSSRRLETAIASMNCRSRIATNLQQDAFKTLSPVNMPQESVLISARRNVPYGTYAGGFPFASNSFVDQVTGLPLGENAEGGLIMLDIWVRGGDRTNSNIVVTGVPGVGKSAVLKRIMQTELQRGTVVIAIDPEREYKEMCENLGGDWVNAGGGSFIVNPLQFKQVPLDDEGDEGDGALYGDTDTTGGFGSINTSTGVNKNVSSVNMTMALHFKTLEVFFKLYNPEITTKQMALLKRILEKLYNSFGITWDTDARRLKNTDYPTFTDLYDITAQEREGGELKDVFGDDIFELEVILRELAHGADSFIWNGHSAVDPKSEIICIDTYDLQDTSENVKRAQYYNLLTWSWERMSRDREEKVMLFADEAYLLVDPAVPQSLIYMRNVAKRARKYMAGLAVIFHSVTDVLDPSVKMYGQALLDTPAYKILMGTDGVNLAETAKIYNLTDAEQERLHAKLRGWSVFIAGSRRITVYHRLSENSLKLMGKGGGR